ncbi:MAG: hypothetical protein ABI895_34930 [Deltaproteobacteria bacterium]
MGQTAERLLVSSGPFTAIRALDASAEQRAQALHPGRALSVLAELAREARSGNGGTARRLLELLAFAPSFFDLRRLASDAWLARIEQALGRKQLLFVPGWNWVRTVAPTAARGEAAQAASETETSAPPARSSAVRPHELRFEYVTNTGHPITDDDGFELRGPGGAVQKGKLANGRLHRMGVEPGAYELRTRSIQSARWSTTSAGLFESVELVVTTRGFPDGTQVDLVIRLGYGPPDASEFHIQAEIQSDQARASWAYEQAIGGRLTEQFQFEASVGKKHARSGKLTVSAHASGTPQGTQERLRARGYDAGPPANDWIASLRAALRRYQAEHPPLIASGDLDPFTVGLLDDPFAHVG